MKPIIMTRFEFIDKAEKYANDKFQEGYRLISFSSYKDMDGVVLWSAWNLLSSRGWEVRMFDLLFSLVAVFAVFGYLFIGYAAMFTDRYRGGSDV